MQSLLKKLIKTLMDLEAVGSKSITPKSRCALIFVLLVTTRRISAFIWSKKTFRYLDTLDCR